MRTFKELIAILYPNFDRTDQLWDFVQGAYSEPWRHYHNSNHITHCLKELEEVKKLLRFPLAAELAIWYHDIIYIPGSKLNEKMSAQVAAYNVQLMSVPEPVMTGLHLGTGLGLVNLIEGKPLPEQRGDWKYFRDIDYGIFAKSPDEYDEYVRNIYLEYLPVYSKNEIKQGRKLFLEKLLRKIFLTEYYRDLHGREAKENIKRELAESDKITAEIGQ